MTLGAWIGAGDYLSGFGTLRTKTVTTSGTAVQILATETAAVGFIVQALRTNTGFIFVGGSDVLASSNKGIALAALDWYYFPFKDIQPLWIDATVNGEGVSITPLV